MKKKIRDPSDDVIVSRFPFSLPLCDAAVQEVNEISHAM